MPRKAVTVTVSLEKYVKDRESKACQLEQQLAGENSNNLRVQLCEILSDLLLTDPAFSVRKNVPERLWRSCFYKRISKYRAKIAKDKKAASALEQQLTHQLNEAITLYEFLCKHLQKKLFQEDDDDQETASLSTTRPASSKSTEGVIDCLYRLQIHLGDLYRYQSLSAKSEAAYATATKLGPGVGHAYNQLGVVCQQKDDRAIALYSYARALLACDVFATARSNLARLFQATTTANEKKETSKSRIFLADFVDMHSLFFAGVTEESAGQVCETMDALMVSLEELLQSSSLGDSLLCKLVVIQSFSECFVEYEGQDAKQLVLTTMLVSRISTLKMACILADRVIERMGKQSGRLLLPLLLITEYLDAYPLPQIDSDASIEDLIAKTGSLATDFWKKIVSLLNILVDLKVSGDGFLPKEYRSLRGFLPFKFLPPLEKGFVSVEEACQLFRPTSSEETGSVNSIGTDQGRAKVLRFLAVGEKLVERDHDHAEFIQKQDGKFVWIEAMDEDSITDGPPMMDDDQDMLDEGENSESLLVYKQDVTQGVALLVPGALLQEQTNTQSVVKGRIESSMTTPDDKAMQMQPPPQPTLPTPASLLPASAFAPPPVAPPPGFGNDASTSVQASSHLPPATANVFNRQQPSLLESLHLFDRPAPTANPFAQQPGFDSNLNDEDFLLMRDAVGLDGAPLLDSSLLSSILSDDSPQKTKNPFAT